MSQWIKVVTHPLGLAGFALFLVFAYLARVKRNDERRWLSPAAVLLAFITLVGSLVVAHKQVTKESSHPTQTVQAPPDRQQTNSDVQQTSKGAGSPNVQGVQGDVTITVDQSTGKTVSPQNKPKKTNH
jgi:apolipoprotein N-acyltransferase